jgi:hypothetical protein
MPNMLQATDLVVRSGRFGMVVLDLGGVPARDAALTGHSLNGRYGPEVTHDS